MSSNQEITVFCDLGAKKIVTILCRSSAGGDRHQEYLTDYPGRGVQWGQRPEEARAGPARLALDPTNEWIWRDNLPDANEGWIIFSPKQLLDESAHNRSTRELIQGKLQQKGKSPDEAIRVLFQRLREHVQQWTDRRRAWCGCPLKSMVITIPNGWSQTAQTGIESAAKRAGFGDITFVSESEAGTAGVLEGNPAKFGLMVGGFQNRMY